MDLSQFDSKLVELELKSGEKIVGIINFKANMFGFEDVVPFVSTQNNKRMIEKYKANNSDKIFFGVPKEEVLEFFEFIPLDLIKDCKVVEREIHTIRLITQNKKEIELHNAQLELKVADKPGFLTVNFKIPNGDKLFNVGDIAIKDGVVDVEISVTFISYAREDESVVSNIVKKLNEYGVVTWFDKNNLLPGSNWEMNIEKNIERADYFLLFLSKNTQEKIGFKNREIRLALTQQSYRPEGKIFIIPILLDDCDVPHNLRNLNWLKASDPDWLEKLLSVIVPWYVKKDFLGKKLFEN